MSKCHVLICEDDPSILEVTKLILLKNGYTVTGFSNCNDLTDKVLDVQPDCVLVNLRIAPDGRAAIKALKENVRTKHISVFIFSALYDLEKIAKEVNADGWISKPFDLERFERLLKKYC